MLGLVLMTLLARMLQPQLFGEYSVILALMMILSIPVSHGFRQTLTRATAGAIARGEHGRIAGLLGWSLKWAFGLAFALAIAIALFSAVFVQDAEPRTHLFIVAVILLVFPAPHLFAGLLHGFDKVALSQIPELIVHPAIMIALTLALFIAVDGALTVAGVMILFAISILVSGVVSIGLATRYSPIPLRGLFTENPSLTPRELAASAASFSAIAGVFLVNSNLDLVLLGVLATEAEAGIYRAAVTVAQVVALGLAIINPVIMPKIAGLHADGDYVTLQRLTTKSVWIVAPIAVGAAVVLISAGPTILRLLFGEAYTSGYSALVILTIGQCVNAFFGPVALILNMTGYEKLTLLGFACSVVVNAALNVLLIPRFGIEGAAIATGTTLLLWNMALAILLWRKTGLNSTILPTWVMTGSR